MATSMYDRLIHRFDERIESASRRVDGLARNNGRKPDRAAMQELRDTLDELRLAEAELVSDHKRLIEQSEQWRQESAAYHELFDVLRDACIVTGVDGRITHANHAAGALLHRVPAELTGERIHDFLGGPAAALDLLLARAIAGESVEEAPLRLAGADPADVLVSLSRQEASEGAIRWQFRVVSPDTPLQGGGLTRRARDAEEYESTESARDEFLGLMSHELKTPIAVIAGNAEVLQRRDAQIPPEQRAEALADIRAEAERLHRVVDNLLVLSRLERGQQIGREPLDIARVINGRVDQHRLEWPDREVSVHLADDLPPIDGSETYTTQALRNLLTNAEQHSPPGAVIEVRALKVAEGVVVSVLDRGGGVHDRDMALLFTPFYRATGVYPTQGIGIGLAVARRLIESQRGHVWAERRQGGGMAFSFWLPNQSRGND